MNPRLYTFIGGNDGEWNVTLCRAVKGEPLPNVERLTILQGNVPALPAGALWQLRGATSNERYVTRPEKIQLLNQQAALGRPQAACAALIPIRKNAAWWNLTQDERRAIFEESSRHIHIGLKYLPNIARRLHHCRDLSEPEPFDFLTLFDYAPEDANAFEEMVAQLRATEEWNFVERESDLRMVKSILENPHASLPRKN
jgi:chlorite dismutase